MNWNHLINIAIIVVSVAIIAEILWLLVPTIFRAFVAPIFDGSYEPRKERINSTETITPQNNTPSVKINSDSGQYVINFGLNRDLRKGNVRIHYNGDWYAAIPSGSEKLLQMGNSKAVDEEDQLGKYRCFSQEWQIPNSEFVFRTRIYQYIEQNYLVFEVKALSAIPQIATGQFNSPVIHFPSFSNASPNQRVFTYHNNVFCPPKRDFQYETSPVLLFDDRKNTILVSALDNFLTNGIQKKSEPSEATIFTCGPNGEIEELPNGLKYKYIMVFSKGINNTFDLWGDLLRKYHQQVRKDRYMDVALSYLGYFTDNGAHYYYNPIKGKKYDATLLEIEEHAKSKGINFGYYQLDSWWYRKSVAAWKRKVLGNFGRIVGGGLYGGTLRWEVDPEAMDMTPKELSQKLGGKPFLAHNRWYDLKSSYPEEFNFIKGKKWAMPDDPTFWNHIMQYCKENRIEIYEQDWMKNQLKEFPHLRSTFGLAEQWLIDMAKAAEKYGITIQYCMTTPAMAMTSLLLPSVSHMRASGDYNPRWPHVYDVAFMLQTSMLAGAVGLWPFKDVFESTTRGKINGEQFPELIGLISSTSGGPVTPGDEIGFINKDIVSAVARKDGLLYKPDRPMTATDLTYIKNDTYYVSTTESRRDGRTWFYSLTINFWPHRVKNHTYLLSDIDILGDFIQYDWFDKSCLQVSSDSNILQKLKLNEYCYRTYAPVFPNGMAIIGDPSKYITMSDREFAKCSYSESEDNIVVLCENIAGGTSEILIYSEKIPSEILIDGLNLIQNKNSEFASFSYDQNTKMGRIFLSFTEKSVKKILLK